MEPVIKCSNVSKDFIMYHHFTGGIKSFLFNLPNALVMSAFKIKVEAVE